MRHNNVYKCKNTKMRMIKERKGQVTIFVILGIVLIAILLIVFNVKIREGIKKITAPSDPIVSLQSCVQGDLKKAVEEISSKGGSITPVNYYAYQGEKIEYLCYTNEYYKTCTMQQPMLKLHMEKEIYNVIKKKVEGCVNNLKAEFSDRGYVVSGEKEKINVEITLDKINVNIEGFNVKREEQGARYDKFVVTQNSKMYNLVLIANSILNFEARYGDAETTSYMIYYPGIKVQKLKQSEGSKVYILTQENDKLVFATRSISWPAGYNLGEIVTPLRI